MNRPTSRTISNTTWLRQRQVGISKRSRPTTSQESVKRLKQEATLGGHFGCVNCIDWNRHGSLLASGSDDRTIIVWDPFKRRKENSVTTGHDANIFSVKFMPAHCDTIVASCAGDFCVKQTDVITSRNLLDCHSCHSDRVKQLAVHAGEPNLLWSAGEDGLIIQYDDREAHDCRRSASRNILIDLKTIFPSLKAKCLAVNPMKSEMLAVGATDIYNRLFDRRYLKLSHNNTNLCFRYFAAGHLTKTDNRSNNIQSYGSTSVSFSPDGSELLASIHAEQVYLFDLNEPWEGYKTFDHTLRSLLLDKVPVNGQSTNNNINSHNNNRDLNQLTECLITKKAKSCKPPHWNELRQMRHASGTDEGKFDHLVDSILKQDRLDRIDIRQSKSLLDSINIYMKTDNKCSNLYLARARILLTRGWRGDYYQAMRDCCCALALHPLSVQVIECLAETLTKLGHSYSIDGLIEFIELMYGQDCKTDCRLAEACAILRNHRSAKKGLACDNNNECDILTDNDLDHGDFMQSLMQPSNTCLDIQELLLARNRKHNEIKRAQRAQDYMQRFCGHCNMNTDIKQASFFGSDGEFIVSGSDDGAFYIWDKKSGNIVKAVDADYQIVNCIQPHPSICMLATSGIESSVKLWSPGGRMNHDVCDLETRCDQNQKFIAFDPLEAMILMLYPDLN